MARVVEDLIGAYCLFLQGAAGNINPALGFRLPDQRPEDLHKPSDSLGIRLGCEVVRVWETISVGEAQGLNLASKTISLPRYMYGDLKSAKQLDGEFAQELKSKNLSDGRRHWAALRQSRVREAIRSYETGVPLDPVEAELQAWRIGDLAFVTAPAEIFTENGTLVKNQSSFDHTFFVGYTNGSIGYVPTVDAYPEGGYEVTHACQVDPEAGGMVNQACLTHARTSGVSVRDTCPGHKKPYQWTSIVHRGCCCRLSRHARFAAPRRVRSLGGQSLRRVHTGGEYRRCSGRGEPHTLAGVKRNSLRR